MKTNFYFNDEISNCVPTFGLSFCNRYFILTPLKQPSYIIVFVLTFFKEFTLVITR